MLGVRRDTLNVDWDSALWRQTTGNTQATALWAVKTLYRSGENDGEAFINAARVSMVIIGVAAGLLTAWWAYRIAGAVAALVAAVAFALDPNFLAHAPLVKNDVATAFLMLAMMGVTWEIGRRVTVGRVALLALICGPGSM